MSDLTSIERRFRMANPVPDPSNPPVPASSAAAALLDINARSIEMQTQVQQLPDQPLTESCILRGNQSSTKFTKLT